jgi:hypothetical protein
VEWLAGRSISERSQAERTAEGTRATRHKGKRDTEINREASEHPFTTIKEIKLVDMTHEGSELLLQLHFASQISRSVIYFVLVRPLFFSFSFLCSLSISSTSSYGQHIAAEMGDDLVGTRVHTGNGSTAPPLPPSGAAQPAATRLSVHSDSAAAIDRP